MAQVAPSRKDSTRDVEKFIARCPKLIEDRTNRPDAHLRKFTRGKMLGKGGFAICFEATHINTGALYAVKVVDKQSIQRSRAREKLKSEIIIHRGLTHERVVKFESYFDDEDFVYIILEICPNQTLNDMIRARKSLTEPEAKYYILQLVNAIKYLHKERVIHRDLKLGNLFIDADMSLKVGDFGLAAKLNNDCEQKRTICGTPNYIAPEVLRNRGHSLEVDIWSLGVIMYTMLVGRPPFETKNVQDTYKRIESNQYQFPSHCRISTDARSLINSMLQVNPTDRLGLDQIVDHAWLSPSTVPTVIPRSALKTAPNWEDLKVPKGAPLQAACWKANQLPVPVVLNQFDKKSSKPRENTPPHYWDENKNFNTQKAPEAVIPKPMCVSPAASSRGRAAPTAASTQRAAAQPSAESRYRGLSPAPTTFASASKRCPDYGREDDVKASELNSCPSAPVLLTNKTVSPRAATTGADRSPSVPATRRALSRGLSQRLDEASSNASTATTRGVFAAAARSDSVPVLSQQSSRAYATVPVSARSASLRSVVGASPESPRAACAANLPAVPWISQWIDFSSRYGLGYRLCDGSIGVYFNDATRIVAPASGKEKWCEFIGRQKDANGNRIDVRTRIPLTANASEQQGWTPELKKKVTLMRNFKQFMATGQYKECCLPGKASFPSCQELQESGQVAPQCLSDCPPSPSEIHRVPSDETAPIHLKKWLSTSTSVAFQMSNKWVQVHFADESELLVSPSGDLIYYVDKQGKRHGYNLEKDIPSAEAGRRLEHAKHLLGILMKGVCGQIDKFKSANKEKSTA